MKRLVLASVLVLLFAIVAIANAQGPGWWGGGMMGRGQGGCRMGPGMMEGFGGYGMGPGMMWGGQGGNYCPYCGQYLGPRGGYGGYGMGPGMMRGNRGYGMGPGIMGGYGGYGTVPGYGQDEECQKFLDETAGLRKELYDKNFEYSEALRNPKTTAETTAKLDREIRDLQEKIYSKAPRGCAW